MISVVEKWPHPRDIGWFVADSDPLAARNFLGAETLANKGLSARILVSDSKKMLVL
jgi:hypothetical protein